LVLDQLLGFRHDEMTMTRWECVLSILFGVTTVTGCNSSRPASGELAPSPRTEPHQPEQPRDAGPAAATAKRLTLPGWEDLVLGTEPPADAVQRCEQLDDAVSRCRGCRSAKLPIACVEINLDHASKRVDSIIVKLPDDDAEAAAAVSGLTALWGTASSRGGQAGQLEWEAWRAPSEQATLTTSYIDASSGQIMTRPQDRVLDINPPTAVPSTTTSGGGSGSGAKNQAAGADQPTRTSQDVEHANAQRCADLAAKWCKDERYVYGSRLMAADQQICAQGGCQYPGQAGLPDTFDDRGCRNRLTKLCERGRARFKVKPGRDPTRMFAWCVDIDDMDEWQCH
jgi:hypothetical protein